jgi:ATP-dependent RNA helicase RhlE
MKNTEISASENAFAGLGLSAKIVEVLTKLKITEPTPIQTKAIPAALEGNDLIGIAQTGTGKTFAFGLPMLVQLSRNKGKGLVLLPTRELALQVEENLRLVGSQFGLRTAILIGGEPISKQTGRLRQLPHIVVATPGRLIDALKQKLLSLSDVKVLVLDEADMMLDMGFLPQVEQIVKNIPKTRQTMLFSATMPAAIARLTAQYMQLPITIEVAPAGTTAEMVDQEMFVVRKEDKLAEIEKILKKYAGQVLIFTRTRRGAEGLTRKLNNLRFEAGEIHSDRSLEQRKRALASFKSGKIRVLVATDIAARGIDVKGIELVINYDLPDDSSDYVHRIGRTGRAGLTGHAISLATPEQYKDVKSIEALIKMEIKLTQDVAEFIIPANMAKAFGGGNRRGGGRSNFASRGSMNSMTPLRAPVSRTANASRPRPTLQRQNNDTELRAAMPRTSSSEVAYVKPFTSVPGRSAVGHRPASNNYKSDQPKTYRVSAGDLDMQDIGGSFGGGLQPRYHSYAEKLKAEAGKTSNQASGSPRQDFKRASTGPRKNASQAGRFSQRQTAK